MARKKSILTEKQAALVEGLLDGKSQREAVIDAGYSDKTAPSNMMESTAVREEVARARAELSSAAQITRLTVVQTLQEAVEMARMMADPGNMIAGAREIGKMLGLYEPEKKSIDLTLNQNRIRSQYERLTDQELLEVIEGEATRVEH